MRRELHRHPAVPELEVLQSHSNVIMQSLELGLLNETEEPVRPRR
jgi:hypothetical protein